MPNPKLTGGELFIGAGAERAGTVHDFWTWAFSSLNSNVIRGALAEYIVASALGMTLDAARDPWAPVDLLLDGRLKIEVKASAYVQEWGQKQLTKPEFGIGLSKPYDAEIGAYGPEKMRSADLYVFCLFTATSREAANPLDLDLWEFYVVQTSALNTRYPDRDRISLMAVKELDPQTKGFVALAEAILAYDRL